MRMLICWQTASRVPARVRQPGHIGNGNGGDGGNGIKQRNGTTELYGENYPLRLGV
jgi:hypothetical protein